MHTRSVSGSINVGQLSDFGGYKTGMVSGTRRCLWRRKGWLDVEYRSAVLCSTQILKMFCDISPGRVTHAAVSGRDGDG